MRSEVADQRGQWTGIRQISSHGPQPVVAVEQSLRSSDVPHGCVNRPALVEQALGEEVTVLPGRARHDCGYFTHRTSQPIASSSRSCRRSRRGPYGSYSAEHPAELSVHDCNREFYADPAVYQHV